MASIVLLIILLVVFVAAVAYAIVGRVEAKRSSENAATGVRTCEGIITARVDCADGRTLLSLRVDADGSDLDVEIRDALTPAGLRVGQRVRVHAYMREVPDVDGAFVDWREPPQHRTVLCATAIDRLDGERKPNEELTPLQILYISMAGALQALRLVHLRQYGVLIGMIVVGVGAGYLAWWTRRKVRPKS